MAEANFRLPPPLDLNDPNLSEAYIKWKRQLDVYLLATGATGKDDKVHTAIILHCGGTQLIEAYEHFQFAEAGDKHKPAEVLKKIEEYCTPKQNIVMQTFRFWTIRFSHPFDSFLTELRTRAESCKFEDMKERMIRDKIVFTVSGKLQELLLRESDKAEKNHDLKMAKLRKRCHEQNIKLNETKSVVKAKELLAVVYGLERFRQYTYGRPVLVQNDQKPLESIMKKPLSQAPKRLQALMIRLFQFDVKFQYVKGSELVIADTLSRAVAPDQKQDISVMNIEIDPFEDIPDARLEEIKEHVA